MFAFCNLWVSNVANEKKLWALYTRPDGNLIEQNFFAFLQKRYRAVYDYTAADDDEVSFMDGDEIVDVEQIDDGWMYGRVARTGQQGMLPANYVEAI